MDEAREALGYPARDVANNKDISTELNRFKENAFKEASSVKLDDGENREIRSQQLREIVSQRGNIRTFYDGQITLIQSLDNQIAGIRASIG